MVHTPPYAPAPPRPLTGSLLLTCAGIVLLVTAIGSLALTDANLVGSGPENTAAQHVMLCLGLFSGIAAITSLLVALVLRMVRR